MFTAWDLAEHEAHGDTHIDLSFVATADDGMMFGHMALVHLLNWSQPQGTQISWRQVIRRGEVVASMTNFRSALERGMAQRIVRTILNQRPHGWPTFLPDPAEG